MQKDALQNRDGVVKSLAEWEAEKLVLSEVKMPTIPEEENVEEVEEEIEGEGKKERKKRR